MNKAENYIQQVSKGQITVGKYIRAVYNNHLFDLKESKKRTYEFYFSEKHANAAIEAFELQRLALGEKTDEPFILMPWMAAILWLLYGWRSKADGLRRYTKMYIKVARGNAKTEFLAGIGNLAFLCESEPDPQIYWVATKKAQAKIGFDRQKTMLKRLRRDYPEIAQITKVLAHRIVQTDGEGYVTYLGKDSSTEDGFSPLYALVDEWHAHKDDGMIHVMESGMVKRRSPLTCIISTAGSNPTGPCAEFEKRAKAQLIGDIKPEGLLAVMYDLDEDDDWHDKKNWPKPNPSLGISVQLKTLEQEYHKAMTEGVAKENNFKTKNLNIWVSSSKGWISDRNFKASGKKFDPAILDGRVCFGGLDLSRNRDLSAMVLFFPSLSENEPHHVLFRFWCPEENARERQRLDGVPYLDWVRAGYICATPGDIIDQEYIERDILECMAKYKFHSCAFDRHRALGLVAKMTVEIDGANTQTGDFFEGFAQTISTFSEPCSALETMVMKKTLNHGLNPVIEWMNRNVVLIFDSNGNFKIDKKRSSEKVDGMVALAMAIGQWMTYKDNFTDAYSDCDVVVI
jgi:phage terminase large subunit-like protein